MDIPNDKVFSKELALELIKAVEHGNEEHKEWLHDAIMAFQLGNDIPERRG